MRALASSGAVVIIPEVPEWRDLSLAPELALPTVRGALQALQGVPEAAEGPVGLAGFSFGCPQAILAASDPAVRDQVACVVGFGGFCDLERTIRFQLTGIHEWQGTSERLRADPYGRWIVGANHLASAPGFEDADDVRSALYRLAAEAGDRQAPLDTPFFHTFAARLRSGIATERRHLFDLFVHPGQPDPEPEEVEEVVQGMLVAARRESPLLDPADQLKQVTRPVRLIHGRRDHLLPYTETLRLAANLPSHLVADLVITGLLAHSKDDQPPNLAATLRDMVGFYEAIRGILTAV